MLHLNFLTHWGWVTHICVSKLTIFASDSGFSPGRRQAIIWSNAGIWLIGPLGTNFSEIVTSFSYSFILCLNWMNSIGIFKIKSNCSETYTTYVENYVHSAWCVILWSNTCWFYPYCPGHFIDTGTIAWFLQCHWSNLWLIKAEWCIYSSMNYAIIGSGKGLIPVWHQAII